MDSSNMSEICLETCEKMKQLEDENEILKEREKDYQEQIAKNEATIQSLKEPDVVQCQPFPDPKTSLTDIQELLNKINEAKAIGRRLGFPNILYNEQYKELEISITLGHKYNEGQGPDATNEVGEKCEYKTMTGEKGSFQYHWISREKIDKLRDTPHHYYAIYEKTTGILSKIYYIHIDQIIGEIESGFLKGEEERKILNKSKHTNANKSFSIAKIKQLGAKVVYENVLYNDNTNASN